MTNQERGAGERFGEAIVRLVVLTKAHFYQAVRPGSLVILALVTITGAGAVLKAADVPNDSFWATGAWATIVLAAAGALAYVGYFFVVLGFRRLLSGSHKYGRLYATCRDIASLVKKTTGLPEECIGVHVWVIRGWPGLRRLERRATFVWKDRRHTSVTWRRGKGVIGQCWLRDEWILANVAGLTNSATAEEFYALPPAERFNFTWAEAKATDHYKAILAWPLHGGPENARGVVGVLSVDVSEGGAVPAIDAAWADHRADFEAHLAVCEAILEKG